MSILRMVTRYVAVAALRERTWAQTRVYDSDMTPLAQALQGQQTPEPYILVYTDQDDINPVMGKADIYLPIRSTRQMSVVLEIGIASAVRATVNGPITVQFAATDQGMESACDVVEAQCMNALLTDPYSDWGDLFKRLMYKVYRITRRRGGQSRQGVRFAARRLVIIGDTNMELPFGIPPAEKHPINDFIRLARQKPIEGLMDTASLVERLLQPAKTWPTWRQGQAILGLDTAAARILLAGDSPLYEVDDQPSELKVLDTEPTSS
jgi:hypothetical protein